MKVLIPLVVVFILLFVFFVADIPTARDLQLNEDPNILAGEMQTCNSPFREALCLPGYSCVNITIGSNQISACYPTKDVESGNFSPNEYRIDKILKEDGALLIDE